ncbi:hypothetical protein [Seonamhaeicola sp. S2-3]|nr:hypothetical protein [Seonamhaeicola sp. S2-3]
MKNLKTFEVQEMDSTEIKRINGGAIIKISGILDGIKGNTKICFFCK